MKTEKKTEKSTTTTNKQTTTTKKANITALYRLHEKNVKFVFL